MKNILVLLLMACLLNISLQCCCGGGCGLFGCGGCGKRAFGGGPHGGCGHIAPVCSTYPSM